MHTSLSFCCCGDFFFWFIQVNSVFCETLFVSIYFSWNYLSSINELQSRLTSSQLYFCDGNNQCCRVHQMRTGESGIHVVHRIDQHPKLLVSAKNYCYTNEILVQTYAWPMLEVNLKFCRISEILMREIGAKFFQSVFSLFFRSSQYFM